MGKRISMQGKGLTIDAWDHAGTDPATYEWIDERGNRRCGRYSSKRRGSCDTRLDEHGECARQGDHGWSDEERGS